MMPFPSIYQLSYFGANARERAGNLLPSPGGVNGGAPGIRRAGGRCSGRLRTVRAGRQGGGRTGAAPGKAVKRPAAVAERAPRQGSGAAPPAYPGRIRRGLGGAAEPPARGSCVAVRGLLEPGHKPADPGLRPGAGGAVQIAPRLAPQLRLKRRLAERDAALQMPGPKALQDLQMLHPLQRVRGRPSAGVSLRQIGMGLARPGPLDDARRPLLPAGLDQKRDEAHRRRHEFGGQIVGLAGALQGVPGFARGLRRAAQFMA